MTPDAATAKAREAAEAYAQDAALLRSHLVDLPVIDEHLDRARFDQLEAQRAALRRRIASAEAMAAWYTTTAARAFLEAH